MHTDPKTGKLVTHSTTESIFKGNDGLVHHEIHEETHLGPEKKSQPRRIFVPKEAEIENVVQA